MFQVLNMCQHTLHPYESQELGNEPLILILSTYTVI